MTRPMRPSPAVYINPRTDLDRWIFTLKHLEDMTDLPYAPMNEAFTRLEELARVENLSEDERREYEYSLKRYRDSRNQMLYVRREGMARGQDLAYRRICSRMYKQGMSVDRIAALLDMPEDDVRRHIGN